MKAIKKETIRHWLGSDHTDSESLLQLITDLVNKDYTIESFRKDLYESDFNDDD